MGSAGSPKVGSGPVPLRLRQQKKNRTRAVLVNCALELFEREGYDGVTVDDIADAAHVSRATYFNYFDGKAEALFHDEHKSIQTLTEFVAERADRARGLTALADPFVALADRYGEQGTDTRRRIRVILNSRGLEDRALRARSRFAGAVARQLARERQAATPSFDERLLADIAISCYVVALRRWDRTLTRTLPDLTKEAFERCGLFVSGAVKPTRARRHR